MKILEGQVWATNGPYGWVRIKYVMLPGHPSYDGGLPGICWTARKPSGQWADDWFVPCRDEADALYKLQHVNYKRLLVPTSRGQEQDVGDDKD